MKENKVNNSSSIRKVAFASFIGTTIEWYDFFLYQFAIIFLVDLFFPPEIGRKDGILYLIGIYATGFLARPVGAVVCGHYGDRIGRKSMLVFTLLLIGLSTFLIGCLPTYESIGIMAPILLVILRLAQGFAVGGEWGGAVLMAVEYSSKGKRGFFGSFPQMGVPVGLFLATIIFIPLSAMYNSNKIEFLGQHWWRVGFLLSIVLLFIGLYIRLKINESPLFTKIINSQSELSAPILEVARRHPKNILLAMGAKLVENSAFYIYTFFILVLNEFLQKKYEPNDLFYAIAIASLLGLVTVPAFGWLSDSVGRKKVYLAGIIFTGLFAFPFFWLVETGQPFLLIAALIAALSIGHAAMYAPQASFFSELFDTKVRYSGASLGYHLSAVIGGTFPLIAYQILYRTNNTLPIILIFIGMAGISLVSVYLATETFQKDIDPDFED